MFTIDLSGKRAIVFGVANHRSIAWSIAQLLDEAGMQLALSYQNDRLKENIDKLAPTLKQKPLLFPCDVTNEEGTQQAFDTLRAEFGSVDAMVHSIAFANREDLAGDFVRTGWDGFRTAMHVSAYSFILLARHTAPLMEGRAGSMLAMTFQASTRVFPGYNIMGTAKAALEHEVRQLAYELGPKNIRVNAISAGPLDTLAARGIHGFVDMKKVHAERAPLQRNITHREVGATALFLASDLASGVTGEIIHVDSGYHIMGM
jgi:enoyl-[acyl-carrier protein] reductase I